MLLRGSLLMFSAAGLVWCWLALPSFLLSAPAHEVSARIISDARFKSGVLGEVLARLEKLPQPILVQPELAEAKTLIRLRTAEEAMQHENSDQFDREAAAAEQILKSTLSLNPTESFLWMMLYSMETSRHGFDLSNIDYLDRSYSSGPNEGWIALRRNRLALAIFPMLNETQQNRVILEFAGLVDSEFTEPAAFNLTTVGWNYRNNLLARLDGVDIASRQLLAKQLSNDGFKVKIPGVDAEERPWR
jgi:hypothetical protein